MNLTDEIELGWRVVGAFDEVTAHTTPVSTDVPGALDEHGHVRNNPPTAPFIQTGDTDPATFWTPHFDRRCRYLLPVSLDSDTAGEYAATLVQNHTGRRPLSSERYKAGAMSNGDCEKLADLIDDYLWVSGDNALSATIGNYTPRGRQRRGLHTRQRRLLSVKLGTGYDARDYLPGVVYWGGELRVTSERITARCYCRMQNRVGRTFVLWEASS